MVALWTCVVVAYCCALIGGGGGGGACVSAAPVRDRPGYEQIWIRAKSDPKLGARFDWTVVNARLGDSLRDALTRALGIGAARDAAEDDGRNFYAYKLIPIELERTVGELHLELGDEIYVSSEELMAR